MTPALAGAVDLGTLRDQPVRLDITATTLAAWHDDNRDRLEYHDDYASLLNRINLNLAWWRLLAMVRVDTSTYASIPQAEEASRRSPTGQSPDAEFENLRGRYHDLYRIGKASLTYASPSFEASLGDSYVSFGRGLVLSLRKQDELGIDNTLLGAKVVGRTDWLTTTAIAGIANPTRVDQATDETLDRMPPTAQEAAAGLSGPEVFGQDRLAGGRIELHHAGFGLAAHGVHLDRAKTVAGQPVLPTTVDAVGMSGQAPLPGDGSLYLEGAWQSKRDWVDGTAEPVASPQNTGYAIYASATASRGRTTGLIEAQHYRDFHTLTATFNATRLDAFQGLQYSEPPTTEPVTTDTRFLYFSRCVSGGRARVDTRVHDTVALFVWLGQWATWGERSDACLQSMLPRRNDVTDLAVGGELFLPSTHGILSAGLRNDSNDEDGSKYYREYRGEVSAAQILAGAWSLELNSRHRRRFHKDENDGRPWTEGEVYLALKRSPSLVLTTGYEYTTNVLFATNYVNGSVLWRYTSASSVRLFIGQQRGGIKCVSGTCRLVPSFEGALLEWIQRY
jgi:hypothetical protein